jgi:hypothetical protein
MQPCSYCSHLTDRTWPIETDEVGPDGEYIEEQLPVCQTCMDRELGSLAIR